jgi:hypothetical protein
VETHIRDYDSDDGFLGCCEMAFGDGPFSLDLLFLDLLAVVGRPSLLLIMNGCDRPKRSRVDSIFVVSNISPLNKARHRLAAATDLARKLDAAHRLDEAKTVVERHNPNIPSSSDLFVHTNTDSTH